MTEAVTPDRIRYMLLRLNEARRRQMTMGHAATEGDIVAAMDLIKDMADLITNEAAATVVADAATGPYILQRAELELHWAPLDTEGRD